MLLGNYKTPLASLSRIYYLILCVCSLQNKKRLVAVLAVLDLREPLDLRVDLLPVGEELRVHDGAVQAMRVELKIEIR